MIKKEVNDYLAFCRENNIDENDAKSLGLYTKFTYQRANYIRLYNELVASYPDDDRLQSLNKIACMGLRIDDYEECGCCKKLTKSTTLNQDNFPFKRDLCEYCYEGVAQHIRNQLLARDCLVCSNENKYEMVDRRIAEKIVENMPNIWRDYVFVGNVQYLIYRSRDHLNAYSNRAFSQLVFSDLIEEKEVYSNVYIFRCQELTYEYANQNGERHN